MYPFYALNCNLEYKLSVGSVNSSSELLKMNMVLVLKLPTIRLEVTKLSEEMSLLLVTTAFLGRICDANMHLFDVTHHGLF
jgi:hypothetical protein